MMTNGNRSRVLGVGVSALVTLLLTSGCHFDTSGIAPTGWWVGSYCEVWDCPKTTTPPSFTLTGVSKVSNYKQRANFWKDKTAAYQVYWHPPIFAHGPVPSELAGATMIMTGRADWSDISTWFMTIKLNEDVAGVYVAYDSRANPKPTWLTDPLRFTKTGKKLPIGISDPLKQNKGFVDLDIYVSNEAKAKNAVLHLPGNNYGNPGWGSLKDGEQAMYVVFVTPKATPDCSKGSRKGYFTDFRCHDGFADEKESVLAAAKTKVKALCEAEHPNYVCRNEDAHSETWMAACDKEREGCTLCREMKSAISSQSEVAFHASGSSMTGTIAGSSISSAISGTLLFDYKTDALGAMDVMLVNSMVLTVDPFETELGDFTDVSVALYGQTGAGCQDSPAPVATPCGHYQIPTAEFLCTMSGRIDGDLVAIFGNSDSPIDIMLDTTTHTFTFTGNLQSTVALDGETFDVDVTVVLDGQVLNYAPTAAADYEGPDFAECSDQTNGEVIQLHASQSYDVDGSFSTGSFEWYEDLALVTEKFWGSGPSLTIPQHALGYGEHAFTLLVTDSYGVLDSDTITVRVYDTQPPLLEPPPDIVIFTVAAPPVDVELGEAFAADDCLPMDPAWITNDAPADNKFDAGETVVTWTAEDGRGNKATAIQKVFIHTASGPASVVDAIRTGVEQLKDAVHAASEQISACGEGEPCEVDLGFMQESIEQLIRLIEEAGVEEGSPVEVFLPLVAELEAAVSHVLDAVAWIEESNADGADVMALRGQAVDELTTVNEMMDGVASNARAMDGQFPEDEPGPGAVDAGTTGGSAGGARGGSVCGAGMITVVLPMMLTLCMVRHRRRRVTRD